VWRRRKRERERVERERERGRREKREREERERRERKENKERERRGSEFFFFFCSLSLSLSLLFSAYLSDLSLTFSSRVCVCVCVLQLLREMTSTTAAKHLFQGVGKYSEIVFERAKGSWMYDIDGKRYLDFSCGIAVTNLGHTHPRIVKRIQRQVEDVTHLQMAVGYHKPLLELTEKLVGADGILDKSFDRVFYWNSGADAVESAMKLARHATKKPCFIAFQGGFHGRTFGTMGITSSKNSTKAGFAPFVSGIHFAPFPSCKHCPGFVGRHGISPAANRIDTCLPDFQCCNNPIDQLDLIIKTQTTAGEIAAVIIEPVLGEGGYVVAPKDFFKHLRKWCDKNKILLIFDEVQTGYGRTGTMFAYEQLGVVPDILCSAKGVANGLPLSFIASRTELTKTQPSGTMGGTYAGNAVACAAACEVIDVFREEKILDNVKERGHQLTSFLRGLDRVKYHISEVRAMGLMIGIEFDHRTVPAGFAGTILSIALKKGLFLMNCSPYEVLRFMPPLNISKEDMSHAIAILTETFDEAVATIPK
jgi:4-aminobutyrate aminotransferase